MVAVLVAVIPSAARAATAVYQPVNCFNAAGSSGCGAEPLQDFSSAAVASPDGKQVYSLSSAGSTGPIVQYDRNAATGALTRHPGFAGCLGNAGIDGCSHAAGLNGPFAMAFSADGTRAYVSAYFGPGVVVLKRNTGTGELSELGGTGSCFTATGSVGCTAQTGLYQSAGIAVAPDGKNVYVTSLAASATTDANASIAVFDVNSGGTLAPHFPTFCFNSGGSNGCATLAAGAIGGHSPVVTATRVYAPMSTNPGGILVFLRSADGSLTQPGSGACIAAAAQPGCTNGDDQLGGTIALAVSPGASQLYAAGLNAVLAFARTDSALTQIDCISEGGLGGCKAGAGLGGIYGLSLSSAAGDLAVGSAGSNGVAFLLRNPANGTLSQLDARRGCVTDNGSGGACRVGPALGGNSIPTAAGGNAFYAGGSRTSVITGFRRDLPPSCTATSATTAFNTPVGVTLPCSDPDGDALAYSITGQPASGTLSSVAGGHAFYTPSAGFSGSDAFTFTARAFGQTSAPATAHLTVAPKTPTLAGVKVRPGWKVTKARTKVTTLVLSGIPAGTTVRIDCRRHGKSRAAKRSCPFATKRRTFNKATAKADLTKYFKKRQMIPGTAIELRLTKLGAIGKIVRYTIRSAKRPRTTTRCLPPGAAKEVACAQ